MQRLTLVLFCAVLALMSTSVLAKNKDLFLGNRTYGDYLLEQQEVELRSIILTVREKDVHIKGDGIAKITRIEIYDLKGNKHSATPTLVSGGPGQTFASINFKSQRGHGIHFLVKVYGKAY